MKGNMHQLIETMWKNGASRAEAQSAALDLSRGMAMSRQARNKLLVLFYGTTQNPKPVRRTTRAAVDLEWRVFGGSRPYAVRFDDLPVVESAAPTAPSLVTETPMVPELFQESAVEPDALEQPFLLAEPCAPQPSLKGCLRNGRRAAPSHPRSPESVPSPLTPICRPRKRARLVCDLAVIGIERRNALAPYKEELFYSAFDMARSHQLALQGLLEDMPSRTS